MPEVATAVALVVELGGGLMLALGWKARWAALAWSPRSRWSRRCSSTISGTWPAPELVTNQIFFFKNVAVIGGLLMVVRVRAGRLSLDKG